jgi:hypothetical protein
VTAAPQKPGRPRRWLRWTWPLGLLLIAWLIAPVRAGALYPGMPCTAQADTAFRWASYTLFFVPTAAVLLLLTRRLIPAAMRRGLRAWTAGLILLAFGVAIVFLAYGGVSADRRPFGPTEQAVNCPSLGAGLQPLHCWQSGSTIEMNAYGQRPLTLDSLHAMASAMAADRQDATLYEAFVLDTSNPSVANYSNARLFILRNPGLTDFADLCQSEHQARYADVLTHRVGFYRFSQLQSPPVNAFFLQDTGGGETGYEVIDFLNGQATLPFVRPSDLRPAESAYLDRVTSGVATLNQDLDRETQSPKPPGALASMRRDFERITADLASSTPPRLVLFRDTRVQRFLENYDLILTSEESAAQGQSAQAIHSSAYEQHRRYYYQESRVARLIGYLYLQSPGQAFTDDQLSPVNWAVF